MSLWHQQQHQQQDYHAVADDDILDESQFPGSSSEKASPMTRRQWSLSPALRIPLLLVAALAFLAILGHFARNHKDTLTLKPDGVSTFPIVEDPPKPVEQNVPAVFPVANQEADEPESHHSRCAKRREWRTLKRQEQQAYVDAALCLHTLYPFNDDLESAYTGYDDFPWIDAHHGYLTHGMAPYLPWHRFFLHLYERDLRQRCGYKGSLVYWDWTLDVEDFTRSPVLDPFTGFGGDGEAGAQITAGATGRCIVDGPFAGLQAEFWNGEVYQHCLSRGFRELHSNGGDIRPDSIEELLNAPTYEDFVAEMEDRVRDTIPFSIGGEFDASTASYDPLFFLHFTQIDRLWWLWQQRQERRGLFSYGGQREPHSLEQAQLDDELNFGGLGKTVTVMDVMNTEKKDLCYRY